MDVLFFVFFQPVGNPANSKFQPKMQTKESDLPFFV